MIKKLRNKFVLIAMASFFIVSIAILLSINGVNYFRLEERNNRTFSFMIENGGKFPKTLKIRPIREYNPNIAQDKNKKFEGADVKWTHITPETPFETRYFSFKVDAQGKIAESNTENIAALNAEEALQYAQEALDKGKSDGYISIYRYKLASYNDEQYLIFLDCQRDLGYAGSLFTISATVWVVSLLVVFLLLSFFSNLAINPIVVSMEKQKQFITDAGHEIKTPLAIIGANNDVIEMTVGESDWTKSIRHQIQRLSDLVADMLTLTKMEETSSIAYHEFSLSEAVEDIANSFAAVAQSAEKNLTLQIENGITLLGDEGALRRVVGVLVDNAIKYSNEKGAISVVLSQTAKKQSRLVVTNTTAQPLENPQRVFDRFYREDSSRARETGGYGIGLSIAQAVVEMHKGKISVENSSSGVSFTIIL